ncbi:MAG: hypothetical protein ACJAS4_000138 [Bacteriovoracaceae bacterium]|jgi:hypothetical protein
MKLKALVAIVAACLSVQSFAGLLVDPYFGVGQIKTTADVSDLDGEAESYTSIGSRVGYSFILVSAGIDYEMGKYGLNDDDISVTNMSFFVGVDLPILIRAWAEYQISSDISGSDADLSFKDGYSVGVGFTGLPFVSLNLEIAATNYELDLAGNKVDFTTASTLFSVSLPLDL